MERGEARGKEPEGELPEGDQERACEALDRGADLMEGDTVRLQEVLHAHYFRAKGAPAWSSGVGFLRRAAGFGSPGRGPFGGFVSGIGFSPLHPRAGRLHSSTLVGAGVPGGHLRCAGPGNGPPFSPRALEVYKFGGPESRTETLVVAAGAAAVATPIVLFAPAVVVTCPRPAFQ